MMYNNFQVFFKIFIFTCIGAIERNIDTVLTEEPIISLYSFLRLLNCPYFHFGYTYLIEPFTMEISD